MYRSSGVLSIPCDGMTWSGRLASKHHDDAMPWPLEPYSFKRHLFIGICCVEKLKINELVVIPPFVAYRSVLRGNDLPIREVRFTLTKL